MDNKLYIKKFIRDDGEILSFDGNEIYLAKDNVLLARPTPNTTAIDYTEADGGEMISQRDTIYDQPINGLIVPKETDYWSLSGQLSRFFRIRHTYKIIYIKKDGTMLMVDNAWISSGLQIIPVPYETYSTWNITFSIGNTNWMEYAEDSSGHEIYQNTFTLPLLSNNVGGEIWDSVGLVSDNVGEEWERGSGGVQTVNIQTTRVVYPVWTVQGPCVRPKLQNNTTDTVAEFDGTVAEGQTLVVDFAAGTAMLNSSPVNRYLYGIVSLAYGDNTLGFDSDGGSTETSTIQWNNIIS